MTQPQEMSSSAQSGRFPSYQEYLDNLSAAESESTRTTHLRPQPRTAVRPSQPAVPETPYHIPLHPDSRISLILSIIACCGVFFLHPVALFFGVRALRQSLRYPHSYNFGTAGMVGFFLSLFGTTMILLGPLLFFASSIVSIFHL